MARIRNHPAAGDLAGRRLHPPLIGTPFVPAFLAGMIRARVLALAISLVSAAAIAGGLRASERRGTATRRALRIA